MDYIVSVDLLQVNDPTAIVVLSVQYALEPVTAPPRYFCGHIEQHLGKSYPWIVARVQWLLRHLRDPGQCWLVLDITGCGRPVYDMFVAVQTQPMGITITGGDQVSQDGHVYRVPKRDVIASLQVSLQTGRFKVFDQLPLAELMTTELLAFRVKIDISSGHDSYSSWREKMHDDLVLSAAMGTWFGDRHAKQRLPPLDMHRALDGLRKRGGLHLGADRWYAEDLPPQVDFDSRAFDEIKNGIAEGRIAIPERSRWIP
jgi:hypothetical protein